MNRFASGTVSILALALILFSARSLVRSLYRATGLLRPAAAARTRPPDVKPIPVRDLPGEGVRLLMERQQSGSVPLHVERRPTRSPRPESGVRPEQPKRGTMSAPPKAKRRPPVRSVSKPLLRILQSGAAPAAFDGSAAQPEEGASAARATPAPARPQPQAPSQPEEPSAELAEEASQPSPGPQRIMRPRLQRSASGQSAPTKPAGFEVEELEPEEEP